jgi:hypothetical protein
MVRKTNRNRKTYKKRKIMRGGFTGDEEIELQGLGFSQQDIEFLHGLNMNMNLIHTSLNTVNLATGLNWTPQELIADLHNVLNNNNNNNNDNNDNNDNNNNNDLDLSNISGESEHNIDINNNDNDFQLNDEAENIQNLSQDSSLHLSDLEGNSSALTDYPSDNSNVSNGSNVFNNSDDSYEEGFLEGGKSKKFRKSRKSKKSRKSRKSKKSRKSRKMRR